MSRDSVDDGVSNSLLEGVQDALQTDGIIRMHDDEIAVSKKVVITVTTYNVTHMLFSTVVQLI